VHEKARFFVLLAVLEANIPPACPPMRTLPLLLICLLARHAFAQTYIELGEAVKQRLVKAVVSGAGGYSGKSIAISLQNLTAGQVYVRIEPGRIFPNKDSSYQDLMLMEEAQFALAGSEQRATYLTGMCTESHNACPQKGQPYSVGEIAPGDLKALAALAASKKYHNSTVQCAVWAIADNSPIEDIYGEDSAMMRQVATIVARAVGKPIKAFHLEPKRHSITNISTSLDCLIPANTTTARLAVYDRQGNLVRTYFEGKALERGFRQFRFAMNHTQGPGHKLFVRLEVDGKTLMQRELLVTDTIPPLQKINYQATFNYELKQPVEGAEIGIYDDKGGCYFLIDHDKTMQAGYQRGTYAATYLVPKDRKYFLQIRDGAGTVVQSKEVDMAQQPAGVFAKLRKSGTYSFTVSAPIKEATLAIYDAKGERIRVIYDHSNFNPGEKKISYYFDHFQGPDAKFLFRLTDGAGNIVREDAIE